VAWNVSGDPVDFDEAVAWFGKRVAMTKADFNRLSATAKRKAFAVANVAQLDLVNHAWKAVEAAIKTGTSLEDFKKSIGPELRKAWGGKVDDPAWRLETIFRTNVQLAYGAGRHQQATHPDVASDRPVWMFDAILDGRETPICRACDGTKLPSDHPWWATHLAPLHHNCRSSFIALSEKQAGRITLSPPKEQPDPKTGFGLPPGSDEWQPDPKDYPKQLFLPFAKKQQAAPPPPPAAELVPGTHLNKLNVIRGVSPAVADDLRASIADAETLKWLETTPLSKLTFRRQSALGRSKVNGWYSPSSKEIEISADRIAISFGNKFVAGAVHSISSSMPTGPQAAKAMLRHELGHHVHMHDGPNSKVDVVVDAAFKRARSANLYITRYAGSSRHEYFAESYVAYYLRRNDLKAHDPNAFKMVENVLTARGILP